MKVLIIGGTGILSTAVVDESIRLGYDVTMVNRGRRTEFLNPKANLIKCDFKDKERVESCLAGMHFDAAIDFLIWNKDHLLYSLSVLGKLVDQYIYISSAQAYNTSIDEVLDENSELIQSLWGYSVNKVISEKYLKKYSENNHINYTIVRPGVNYDSRRIPYGMYPTLGMHGTFIERIKAGKPIITWNNGSNKLNLTRVEDFASGMVGLIGDKTAYNEAFNVVGDNAYTWGDVLTTLGKLINCEVKTIDMPVEFYANELDGDERESLLGGRSTNLVCSNAKLKQHVPSFKTKFNLEDGLKMTVDFYLENDYYHGIDYLWDGACDRIVNKYTNKNDLSFVYYGYEKDKKKAKYDYLTGYNYHSIPKRLLDKIYSKFF